MWRCIRACCEALDSFSISNCRIQASGLHFGVSCRCLLALVLGSWVCFYMRRGLVMGIGFRDEGFGVLSQGLQGVGVSCRCLPI